MRKYMFILFLSGILLSCNDTSEKDIIPPAKMGRILSDVQIAEVYSTIIDDTASHYVTNRNVDSLKRYYNDIFTHHNVTPEAFAKSIDWYKRNPDKLDSVYVKIIPQLTKLEAKYPVK